MTDGETIEPHRLPPVTVGGVVSRLFAERLLQAGRRRGKLKVYTPMFLNYMSDDEESDISGALIPTLLTNAVPGILVVTELPPWETYALPRSAVPRFVLNEFDTPTTNWYLFDLSFQWCIYILGEVSFLGVWMPGREMSPLPEGLHDIVQACIRDDGDPPEHDWQKLAELLRRFRTVAECPLMVEAVEPRKLRWHGSSEDDSFWLESVGAFNVKGVSFRHWGVLLGPNNEFQRLDMGFRNAWLDDRDPDSLLNLPAERGTPRLTTVPLELREVRVRQWGYRDEERTIILLGDDPRPDRRIELQPGKGVLLDDRRIVGFYIAG